MKLELVSFALCPYVHRATTVLHEKGVAHEVKYIDLANKPEWFLAISPRGKVPLLIADGVTLFESAVINEYIDETHPPHLLPSDPLERARQRAWIEVANDLFADQYKLVSAPTKEAFEAVHAACYHPDGPIGRFEKAIQGNFFAGDAFGLVDAAVAPALYRLTLLDARSGARSLAAFPKVEAWARRLAARPSVVQGVLPNFGELLVESLRKRGGHFAREVLKLA